MKFYSLVTERNEIVGYRVETKTGILYDISSSFVPKLPVESKINGSIVVDGDYTRFITNNEKGVIELKKEDVKVSILKGMYGGPNSGPCKVVYDDLLLKEIEEYKGMNERFYVKGITKRLLNRSNYALYELYGVRRTGKTVSMFHIINHLLDNGVSPDDICYISLRRNRCINDDDLSDMVSFFSDIEKVLYIFVDEITFVDGSIEFLVDYGNGFGHSKVIVAGTNSSVFLYPNITVLYDRVHITRTSHISFWEYSKIYPGKTILDYVKSGGLLTKRENYKYSYEEDLSVGVKPDDIKDVSKDAVDYIETSIYDNIVNGLGRYTGISSRYPDLYRFYEKDRKDNCMRSFLYKMAQRFSTDIVASELEKDFKSDDIGRMLNLYKKDILMSEFLDLENGVTQELSYEDSYVFGKKTKVLSKVLNKLLVQDAGVEEVGSYFDYNYEEILREMCLMLEDIGCIRKDVYIIRSDDKRRELSVNAYYFMPLLIRYGLATRVVRVLNTHWEEFCKEVSSNLSEKELLVLKSSRTLMISELLNGVEGLLCEEVIRYTLNGYNSGVVEKFRVDKTGMEIDLLYKDDIIEVKRSSEAYPYQARWLLNSYFLETDEYKNKRRVLLTNKEEDCIMYWSERDALKSLKEHNDSRKIATSNSIIARLESNDSKLDIKQEVHCLNMTRYLLEACKYEITEKRKRLEEGIPF